MEALRALQRAWRTVTPLGRALAVIAVACWVAAARLGWEELEIVTTSILVLLVIGAIFTIGRLDLRATLGVEPSRVVVGDRAAGSLTLVNLRTRASRWLRVELPVGRSSAVYAIPTLPGGAEHDELFVVPTQRRAIIPVGPVTTIQGDPLGIFKRARVWTEREEIYVHPKTTMLSTIAAGLIRDLEGQPTAHLSPSDIAFHTLRDYVPGDDRRHVHWKSSAKNGRLLVRQYVDTRRSHVTVLLSTDLDEYASEDEFELAVSCAASVAVQAVRDEQTLSVFAGMTQLPTVSVKPMLDRFSGVEVAPRAGGVNEVLRAARDEVDKASAAIVCVGSKIPLPDVRKALQRVSVNTATVVLRADLTSSPSYLVIGSTRFLNVAELSSLSRGLEQVLS